MVNKLLPESCKKKKNYAVTLFDHLAAPLAHKILNGVEERKQINC